jgi:PIN domain
MNILHVFADTNIFLQCKPPSEVDWSELGNWDRIDVILTRPLLDEIDELKDRGGNERRTARARSTNSLIRQLLEVSDHRQQIAAKPEVHLCLRYELKEIEPKPSELDYAKRDHQLVGTMLAFCRSQPLAQAILLTNDTGPVACARLMNLPARFVPTSWLLKAEPMDTATQALRSQLDRYKDQEPRFEIALSPEPDNGIEVSLPTYEELSKKELLVLNARLDARYPQCIDFGPSEPHEREIDGGSERTALFGPMKEVWRPVPSDEIEQYQSSYQKWREDCSKKLARLHALLNATQDWPRVVASIENIGSRPANDAIVVLQVHGNCKLRPPKVDDEGERSFEILEGKVLGLPQPPTPPRGSWAPMDAFSSYSKLERSLKDVLGRDYGQSERSLQPLVPRMPYLPTPRESNSFYFKVGGHGQLSERIEFECSQWRHAQGAEEFEVSLVCTLSAGTHAGVVQVEVHAANLTEPRMARLPFKLTLVKGSCFEEAKRCIDALNAG